MIKAVSATYIMLPQQPNLNIIERKFKRQILKPNPIILDWSDYLLSKSPQDGLTCSDPLAPAVAQAPALLAAHAAVGGGAAGGRGRGGGARHHAALQLQHPAGNRAVTNISRNSIFGESIDLCFHT